MKVAITTALHTDHEREVLGRIHAEAVHSTCDTEDEVIALAHDADAVVAGRQPYTERVMANLTKCRIISKRGTGFDTINVEAATAHAICVCNTTDYCTDELSDHAMALILACARKLTRLDRAVKGGNWNQIPGTRTGMSKLRGQTLGLVGFGRIARGLVPKAKGFGLRVMTYDPFVAQRAPRALGVELAPLEELLSQSDYISVHAPLSKQNRGMFGAERFRMMKRTAYFINTARGGLLDEEALCIALSEGRIAGAGLDVTADEPPQANNPLLAFDNVILSGHSGFYSDSSNSELQRRPIEEVVRVLQGRWPRGFVNPEVKERFIGRWGRDFSLVPRRTR